MQSSHAYLLSIQLCLIKKKEILFDLGIFINSRLIFCFMIGPFKVEAPFSSILMEAHLYC